MVADVSQMVADVSQMVAEVSQMVAEVSQMVAEGKKLGHQKTECVREQRDKISIISSTLLTRTND